MTDMHWAIKIALLYLLASVICLLWLRYEIARAPLLDDDDDEWEE